MEYSTHKERASVFTVLTVLGAFALFANDVAAQGKPDLPGDPNAQIEAKLDALEGKVDSIQSAVDAIPPPTDISGLETAVSGVQSDVTDIKSQLDAIDTKLPVTYPGCTVVPPNQPPHFVDKGLTVYDCETNLEWEKKTDGNVSQYFNWSPSDPNFDGTAADYINGLNAVGFAGHKDWRLPMVAQDGGTAELETILDPNQGQCNGVSGACIDSIFGPTAASGYWSSVTDAANPYKAWLLDFRTGVMSSNGKALGVGVRAVRTGP